MTRRIHQQCTSAYVTGELPTAMWLSAKPQDDLGGHWEQAFGWLGCLDAPEAGPAGSVIPVNIPYDIGGCGYEGNVSTLWLRETHE